MKKVLLCIVSAFLMASMSALHAEHIGVPSECEDVMLQCFYWDSNSSTKYGRTKWADLFKDTTAITENFDLVWFPPSAQSTGGVGYYHTCLSKQGGAWGQKASLVKLINALHHGDTKCIADIVINHRGSYGGWCSFLEDNFGEGYGSFQLTQQHICKGDECFRTDGSECYAAPAAERGNSDTGTNDAGARDLDHTSDYVQSWAKAYVRWMLEVMHYDGFRYDMTLGYHGKYLKKYNQEANPYISVSECWESIDRQKQHLQETDSNTMIFDFQQKYELKKAIVDGNYALLKKNSNSFRGQGLEKFAVTFIDNHDTFERDSYGSQQFGGQDLSAAATKAQIMQANAYILSMPGIPCVFWPHWYCYREDINRLIRIRKLAGIHSESEVLEETSGTKSYSATVQGHNHKLVVRVGKNRDMSVPAGFYLHADGDYYSVYIEGVEGVETVGDNRSSVIGEKFVENGQLYIRVGEKKYDMMGRIVKD